MVLPSLYPCNIVSAMASASLSGSQSFLPAVRLRSPGLRREAHRYSDDEGHSGDHAVKVHSSSASRLHRQHHQTDQQPLHAARGRGSRLPGHAIHPTSSEYQWRNDRQPHLNTTRKQPKKKTGMKTFKGVLINFLSPNFFP